MIGRQLVAILFVASAVLTLFVPVDMSAAEPSNQKLHGSGPLEFRRLFVPEGRINEVIGDKEYVSYESEKFERLVRELGFPRETLPPAVLATRATYAVQFNGQSLVAGTAQLKLRCMSSDAATYSLQQCNLALAKPSWKERPDQQVLLGTTGNGDKVLLVEESGTVSFAWSARGVARENGDVGFSLVLPRCTSSQIDLRMPDQWIPRSPDATVRELENSDVPGTQMWRLVVNSSSRILLTMIRQDESSVRRPAAIVTHKDLTYSFDKNLVRFLAEIRFDVDHRPLSQMDFRVSAPLRIRAVRLGESELEFASELKPSGEAVVTVEFPQPIYGIDRRLLVDAVMAPHLDRRWELPSIKVENALWQEGSTTLELADPLTLDRLELDHCLQTSIKPLLDPPGRIIELQQLSPDATVSVALGRTPPRPTYVGASEIRLLDDELRASCTFDFTTTAGKVFELQMDVAPPWNMNSVQAVVAETTGSKTIGEQATKIPLQWDLREGDRKQTLAILLEKAVRPDRAVRIRLQAHRPRPQPEGTISIEQMQVVAPLEVTKQQHLIALYGQAPYRFELQSENEISWFDPAEANPQQQAILSKEPGGLFFQSGTNLHETVAYLTQSAGRFKAKLEVRTTVRQDSLDELFRLRCEPANLISKVTVALTGSGDDEIRWSLEGKGERGVIARRLPAGTRRPAGEVTSDEQIAVRWELTLTRPRDVPFTILGRRHSTSSDDVTLSLPWMPEAASQEGTLILSSGDGTQFEVEHPGLPPFPLPGLPSNRFTGDRAAYRYRPADLPVVRILRRDTKQSTAWAWSCNMSSRFTQAGSLHSACYRIENIGLQRISLKLPANAELQQVLVDGRAVNVAATGDSHSEFALPAGLRYPTVVVTFTGQESLPEVAGKHSARFPEISIPVLRSYWTLWVPPEADCVTGDGPMANSLPRSLFKRLLGPLLGEPDQEPFSLADVRSTWERFVGRRDNGPVESLQRAFQVFTAIRAEDSTWSQFIQSYDELAGQQSDEFPLPPLFVDRRSFQRLAITANGPLPASEESRFEETLDRSGLAILFVDGRVVLVSQQWLSSHRSSLRTSHSPLAWISGDGFSLDGRLSLVTARQWVDAADRTPTPWSALDHSSDSQLFRSGWSAVEFEVDPDEEFTVQLVRPTRILALSWSAFFFAVGLGWWLTVKTPRLLLLAAMFAGTAAVIVPTQFSTIATACLLGLPVGAVIGVVSGRIALVHAKGAELQLQESAIIRNSAVTTALLLVGCVSYFVLARPGLADDFPDTERKVSGREYRKIYSVVIPIDKDERPAEDTVYVPGEFSRALLNLSAKRDASSQPWLLRTADYDLRLNWRGVKNELAATELVATFDLNVSDSSKQVKLPLFREQLHIIPERSMLNGEPIQVDWATEGSGLMLDVGRTGSHILEVAFQPVTTSDDRITRTSVRIPQVHRSVLRVHFPDGATSSAVLDSLGAVTRDREARTVTAALGPIDRISLGWPRNGVGDNQADRISASQISWVTVSQGSVVMRSKFHFNTGGGLLNEVEIEADPRLQLHLQPDPTVEVVANRNAAGGTSRITTFQRTDPAASELSLDLMYSVRETSGIGNILLPRVNAVVANGSVNRWLAVSVGSGLQLVKAPPAGTEPIPAEDFLDVWGIREPDRAVPDATMLLKEGERPIQLVVRPEPVDAQAAETLRLALDRDSATVQYQAEIQLLGGDVFHLRLHALKTLRITEVRLQAAGESIAANWKVTAEGIIVIKSDGPLPERVTVLLLGDADIPPVKDVALPDVFLDSIPVENRVLEIYRRSSVNILLQAKDAWREIDSDKIGSLDRLLGRLVTKLVPADSDSLHQVKLPTAVIRNNKPRPNYQLASVAGRTDGQWWAEIVCRVYGFKGTVDTIRLDIPSSWNEPIESENANVLRVTAPGSDRSQLLVQPLRPLTDGDILRLRGRLVGSPREMPDIHITDRQARMIERFVALQTESANQRTEWQTAGLREAAWPEHLSKQFALSNGRHLLYRVVGQRYRARVGNMGPVSGVPQVRLADLHLYHGEQDYSCVASFDMEPAGLEHCVVQLPSGTRLLYTGVAGQPAISSALGSHRWQVRLSHEQLPQRIEVLFTGRWPVRSRDTDSSQSLPLAQVVGVPVERTLVTVIGNRRGTRWDLQGAEVAALRQERFRIRSMTTLIDLSRTIARDQISEDRRRWFVPWAQRMVASRRRIEGYRSQAARDDKSLEVELSDLAQSQLEAAEDLQTTGLLKEELKSVISRPGLVGAERASRLSLTGVSRTVAKGRLHEVKLTAHPTGMPPLWQRLAAVAAFPFICVVLYFLLTRGPFYEWLLQWFFVYLAVFGVFWWLMLTPSVVGILIVAVSVIAALRSHGTRVTGRRRHAS